MQHEPPKQDNKKFVEAYKQMYIKRYHLEGIDFDKELELIQQKKSNLSRSQRDAVVAFSQIFPALEKKAEEQEENNKLPVGDPLTEKDLEQVVSDKQKESEESPKVICGDGKSDFIAHDSVSTCVEKE